MKRPAIALTAIIVLSLTAGACATVPDDAPTALKDAHEALEVANDQDVDDTFPNTIDRAEERFDESLDNWEMSQDDDRPPAEAEDNRNAAIQRAITAKELADTATRLHNQISSMDDGITADNEGTVLSQMQILTGDQTVTASAPALGENFYFTGRIAFFDTDQATVKDQYADTIAEIATVLADHDGLTVRVIGFADPRGDEAYNADLALRRSQSVADILSKNGLATDRIELVSKGAGSAPEGLMDNWAGLQLERRVEIAVGTKQAIESH